MIGNELIVRFILISWIAATPDFSSNRVPSGKIVIVNDGGVYFSIDGARNWTQGHRLSTLAPLNVAVLPIPDSKPALCIGTADNDSFFSFDGGETWKTQDYIQGDDDWGFADPLQPSRLIVFAPRDAPGGIRLYVNSDGG